MSRSSRKSELSPSATGSNIDLGRKTEPSVTSGGLGVTREITNIGGVSVTGGVSIDISPIDLGINYDSSENAVSVAGGAELPGGLLGASGGVTIDLDTGEVTGGSVGAEGLGLGVNISASKDGGIGVEVTVQIPFTPIEISLGFGFPPKKPSTLEPSTLDPSTPPKSFPDPIYPTPTSDKNCTVYFGASILNWAYLIVEKKVVIEKFEESGSYDFINGYGTSGGKGERKTTSLSTNSVRVESLGYAERPVSAYLTGRRGAPYYVNVSYNKGINDFYVHAITVSGLEKNIYS